MVIEAIARTRPVKSRLEGIRVIAWRYPVSAVAGAIVIFIVLVGVAAPIISPNDPLEPDMRNTVSGPSLDRPLGTDFLGRDMVSRIIHGTRVSLFVALISTLLGTTAGAVWGLASGFLGGKFDLLSQRAVEIMQSFPTVLFALLLATALGAGVWTVILAIGVTRVSYGTRIIRAQALGVKSMAYVDAARAIGASQLRIMAVHIGPQCVAPFIVLITMYLGVAIMIEATLGFLGFGVPPPTPTWGAMLGETSSFLRPPWFLVVFPGAAIAVTVLALNLMGDGIRDALDPRLRGAFAS
jgi:peptide/nickel transport system permease protein